jgi:kumamolisin
METRSLRLLVLALTLGAVILSMTSTTAVVTAASGPPTRLAGHVLTVLASSTRLGDAPADQRTTLTIALRPQTPDAVDRALAHARAAPSAPPLSPDDVAQVIGPAQSTVDQVAGYFEANGFTVVSVARDRLSLRVGGTVGQIQQTLGVSQGIYRDAAGHTFRATSVDPSVPASLAGSIQAIFGLDTYPALKRLSRRASATPGYYAPADIRTAYNVNPLLTSGLDGTGQTIGIVGCETYTASDLQGFNQAFGLPTSNVTQVVVDSSPTGTQAETTLDLEWSHAIAPGAAQRFYVSTDGSGNCSFNGLIDAINRVKQDNTASVVSISYGACEQTYVDDNNILASFETAFSTMALQGEGVFVASGDQGAYCLDPQGNPILGVEYPASSAHVTAVGGTRLILNPDSSWQAETAWGDTCSDSGTSVSCGTGGGTSGAISEPSWQSGAILALPSTGGRRGLPDVALNADPFYGYQIYWTDPLGTCAGLCTGFGGTSIASPQWAGFGAIANQYAKRRLGQLAPLLYSSSLLAARPASQAIYHDVTSGADGTGVAPYTFTYSATPGWDFTTGWGSINACHAIIALAAAPAVSTAASASGPATFQVFLPVVYNNAVVC